MSAAIEQVLTSTFTCFWFLLQCDISGIRSILVIQLGRDIETAVTVNSGRSPVKLAEITTECPCILLTNNVDCCGNVSAVRWQFLYEAFCVADRALPMIFWCTLIIPDVSHKMCELWIAIQLYDNVRCMLISMSENELNDFFMTASFNSDGEQPLSTIEEFLVLGINLARLGFCAWISSKPAAASSSDSYVILVKA